MIFNQRARVFGIECIFNLNGDIFYTNGVDGRGIDNFGSKVTQLHRLDITQFVDGVSRFNHTWVGSHKSIHIGPNLQHLGIQCCSNDGCCIIATATPQVSGLASILIATDKARHHSNVGHILECIANQLVGQIGHQSVLTIFLFSTNKIATIHASATLNQRCHNVRRETLAITYDRIFGFIRQVVNQIHAIIDTLQLFEELIHLVE